MDDRFLGQDQQRINLSLVVKQRPLPKDSMYNSLHLFRFLKHMSLSEDINQVARMCLQKGKYGLINLLVQNYKVWHVGFNLL